MAKKGNRRCDALPILHPDAACIDVGASELHVAVSADRDPQPIRSFPTFTRDLHALADWLEQCGIHSVAMESTSVYWIPVYQILEARGLEVYLVNAQHVKNMPGRKTDVSDCQWLQYLHSVGLLRGSFRPPGFIPMFLRREDEKVKQKGLIPKACRGSRGRVPSMYSEGTESCS